VASFRRRTNGLAPLALRRDAKAGKTNAKPQNVSRNKRNVVGHRSTYFIEKTSVLVRKLITGQGNAKERLRENEVNLLLCLASPLPDDLKPKRDKILKALEKKHEISHNGIVSMTAFQHTLYKMKKETASKIIGDIYDLYSEVVFRERFN
jgi:hypothetical protein